MLDDTVATLSLSRSTTMHDAYTPLVFYRHSHRLRTLMVDNQPWFVAHDFARLIGHPDALPLLQALEPHEQQTLRLG